MRTPTALASRGILTAADLWPAVKRFALGRTVERGADPELRQLRALQRAYSRDDGPDVLMFGDSAMIWTSPLEPNRLPLGDLVRADLGSGRKVLTLAGPGYNARVVSAFVTALEDSPSRPSVVVVPTSVLMSTTLWSESPRHSYRHESSHLREIIAAGGRTPLKGLARSSVEEYEAYDRLPAPSLYGARRTVGEIRLIVNSVPTTRWATAVRMRHMMDYYNAQRLEADSPGVLVVSELGAQVAKLGIPTIAYIPPINRAVVRTTLGEDAPAHVERNAAVIETAFLEAAGGHGHVVNAVFDSPAEEFIDPVHLTFEGRERLARRISDVIRPLLSPPPGPTSSREDEQ